MTDMPGFDHHIDIPGTTVFDGKMAMKGYALNKMCYSFNAAAAREAYLADPEAYMDSFGLNEQQKQACRDKNVLAMIAAGGNINPEGVSMYEPIGGSASLETSVCQTSPATKCESLLAWISTISGSSPSMSSMAILRRVPKLRAKSFCCVIEIS